MHEICMYVVSRKKFSPKRFDNHGGCSEGILFVCTLNLLICIKKMFLYVPTIVVFKETSELWYKQVITYGWGSICSFEEHKDTHL